MTKQEKELLEQLDGVYNRKRLDEMGRLQNKIVADIAKAHLPTQDVAMILAILKSQVENLFASNLYPKQEKE